MVLLLKTVHVIICCTHVVTIFGYEKGWFEILAVLTFPISLGKNFISVVQMIYAAKNIAANDAAQKVKRDH